ncbi:MAG: cell division protein FtsZ [Candidatus Zambryskibacteria bacterium RIFCSPLOWO2_02_FULL_51_21]|uniref:Cell division protein FtsZ n=1 Tax=Candidatus Zambryskibacteria bacterium RIFCSPHIGHO2_02_FULL_43_37 TaxID=1802749 RepID=A0A1G2TJN7_9BACT|nr:MAG: cell division protein FtsZ [Candidatus Zambryskibacteria bacterium RIFCSPHIGHO2_01_FULL_52_18]OHA96899.1 MAG: cell division protein FtsZ [Candidatus Zambryskibacteria bacterium RIFCSPHIGHO2_02_FULL_43_37]OHB07045.1 MAG: cell division protein FtsZ [Candidatus Zambryskibacteria bacterium RIFCSPLOWO2_01_FULL_52_12]OHB11011.1 MAG: cell division protein FtsZ [Candidatus Zambryskibacteria bacterium RIFCSPLOWO2_02_FULL_51_21]
MPQIKPEVESFARIKVIGVGGSGKNTVNHMINSKVKGVEFIAVNTDVQDLHNSLAKKKIHIGKNLTKGLGTGMNPELGKRAIEETKEEVQESIKGADMIFIACGMGGGTGTGAAPIIAHTAKENGCLTVAVVTKPFFFEGQQRMKFAEQGIEELRQAVDALIVIPNDRLLQTVEKNITAKNAFAICDNILKEAVEGISDLITTPGIINIDFADIRSVMENAGAALMGIGTASGENRATDAAKAAISSPLLEISINGAKGVLFSIAGGDDLTMFEIQDAAKVITESVDPNAKIIFGTVRDERLKKGELKITVIASNFPESNIGKKASANLFQTFGQDEERGKGRIFNSLEKSPAKETDIKKPIPAPAPAAKDDEDDDWSAVPAFLRRSKLK